MSLPAGGQVFGQFLQEIEGFNHAFVRKMRTILVIEENAPIGFRQFTHENVDKKIAAGNRYPVNVDLPIFIGVHGQ